MAKVLFNNKFESFTLISSTRLYFANKKDGTAENNFIKINTNESKFLYNSLKISAENLCLCLKNKKLKLLEYRTYLQIILLIKPIYFQL